MRKTKLAQKTVLSLLILLFLAGCSRQKTVNISSYPTGATIYIDGKESGITIFETELLFTKEKNEFKVVAKKDGYKDGTATIRNKPADERDCHIILESIEKTVRITSVPSGATIYINGIESGITPLKQKLSFAEDNVFEVLAKKEHYKDTTISISLEPESQTHYPIVLPPGETVPVDLFEPQLTERGIKLIRKRTVAYLEVIERSPNVRSVTMVTNNENQAFMIGPPVLSPTENILVYGVFVDEGKRTSYSNIWKTTIGSFGKTLVTYGKWQDLFPTFGPSGRYLVFSSNRTSTNLTLWRISIDGGGGITNLTNTLSEDYSPFVSPDANFIAYTSNPPRAEEPQIWTIGINGNLPTQLREGENPKISPDGKKILFVRKDKTSWPKHKQIWVMNTDGSRETQLTQNLEYNAIQPNWSPDGEWIVFTSNEGLDSKKRRNSDIWMMTENGSKKTQLTTNGSVDDSPCWDPGGKFIYFRSNRGGVWNIWRFELVIP